MVAAGARESGVETQLVASTTDLPRVRSPSTLKGATRVKKCNNG